MHWFKIIFDACWYILDTHIYLFGYFVALSNVLFYGFIGVILLYLIFRLLR